MKLSVELARQPHQENSLVRGNRLVGKDERKGVGWIAEGIGQEDDGRPSGNEDSYGISEVSPFWTRVWVSAVYH